VASMVRGTSIYIRTRRRRRGIVVYAARRRYKPRVDSTRLHHLPNHNLPVSSWTFMQVFNLPDEVQLILLITFLFVDLNKVFDSISREALWYKLYAMGMSSRMINRIKAIYRDVRFCVKPASNEATESVRS
jgi:hypothetical protein